MPDIQDDRAAFISVKLPDVPGTGIPDGFRRRGKNTKTIYSYNLKIRLDRKMKWIYTSVAGLIPVVLERWLSGLWRWS